MQGRQSGPQFGEAERGSTLLQDGYFQVSTVTDSISFVQSPPAPLRGPGSGQDRELPASMCPRGGERAFLISRLSHLLSRLFQLPGVAELPGLLLFIAQRVR